MNGRATITATMKLDERWPDIRYALIRCALRRPIRRPMMGPLPYLGRETEALIASASMMIDKPIEEVFSFAADVDQWDQWVEGVSQPRRISPGELGVGSTFASKYSYSGLTHDVTYEITAFDPPNRHAIKAVSGPFPFAGIMELETSDSGTKVTNSIDTGSDGNVAKAKFEKFLPLLRMTLTRQLRKELETLKNCLEH